MLSKSTLLLVTASIMAVAILFSFQGTVFRLPNATAAAGAEGIRVYWDPAATNSCSYISWGQVSPGSSKTVKVYLKNESNASAFYLLTTDQWYPTDASRYISLRWDYNGSKATPNSIFGFSLTLSTSPMIREISEFSFDIVILGSPNLPGDLNSDGKVDGKDLAIAAKAFGTLPGDLLWDARADVNSDGRVDGKDIALISQNFGKTNN